MFAKLGPNRGTSVLGAIALACAPLPFLLVHYGRKWREPSLIIDEEGVEVIDEEGIETIEVKVEVTGKHVETAV